MNPISYSKVSLENGVPVSQQFEDCYFSREDGFSESRYVFLKHNDLPQRWHGVKQFVIGELGFGTGLNFFLTAKEWQKSRLPGQTLHYYAIEKYPISLNTLGKIHQLWPQFHDFFDTLHKFYPNALTGMHRIEFADCGVILYLMIGDVLEQLEQLVCSVDAWYLDGFAPDRNEEMWSKKCFAFIAYLSHENSTFATFTAAGFVRRGLQDVGFEVAKDKGFGRKREMLFGTMRTSKERASGKDPWFSLRKVQLRDSPKTVSIIGAGLAGLVTAWELTKRGLSVTLFDKSREIASGASGNPIGLVMPRYSNDFSLDTQFYYTALTQTVQWIDTLKNIFPELEWHQTGVVQLADNEQLEKARITAYPESFVKILEKNAINELAGLNVTSGGLYFPLAGYISPKQLCEIIYQDMAELVSLKLNTGIIDISSDNNVWRINDENGKPYNSDIVIIANSFAANQLLPTKSIQVEKNRGQLSLLEKETNIGGCKVPIVYDAYVTPKLNGVQVLGASYAPDEQLTPRMKDHTRNINKLENHVVNSPELLPESLDARIAFRGYSQDRMPIVGPVQDETFYMDEYGDLHHGKRYKQYANAKYIPGLYVNVAHGSRGLVSTLPSARLIADMITKAPQSLPLNVINRIHPARFLIRQLKKQR